MTERAVERRVRPKLIALVALAALGAGLMAWLIVAVVGGDDVELGAVPHFVDETAVASIDHVYDGEFEFFVGGGVAAFDCDMDGFPDLFFAGGTNPAALYRNESPVGGALSFSKVAEPSVELTGVTGAYPIDIEGDGLVDLVILRRGENVIMRGRGDCRFERANEALGYDGGSAWTVGFSATWAAAADRPTMAFGNYLAIDDAGTQTEGCADNELDRPVADGYSKTPLVPGWCSLSLLFSDWDRSGQVDLRVSNDRHYYIEGEEQLWRVPSGEAPVEYTAADGWQPLQIWGMGIASQDLTGDGYPEIYLTSQGDNKLQTLAEGATGPEYVDIAIRRGVTAHRPFTGDNTYPSTGWHPEFRDVNNDGLIDLYVSKGNVDSMAEFAAADPNNLFIGQADGTFVEGAVEAGVLNTSRSRGAALVDLNLDGLVELVEVNRREPVRIWRNVGSGDGSATGPMGNWVAIRPQQDSPNRDAVGAWIQVRVGDRTIEHEVTIGGGHAGGQIGWVHFGIGKARSAEVRVQWPDGEASDWERVDAATFAFVTRGVAGVEAWRPSR